MNIKNIHFHPELTWLKPYVQAASKHLPRRTKIARIHAVFPQKNKCLGFFGKLEQKENVSGLTLSLYTHYWHYISWFPKKRAIEPFSKIDILQTLAHELAHCSEWDHTPKHKILENKITMLFMRMLEREGYVSEEEELKEIKKGQAKRKVT